MGRGSGSKDASVPVPPKATAASANPPAALREEGRGWPSGPRVTPCHTRCQCHTSLRLPVSYPPHTASCLFSPAPTAHQQANARANNPRRQFLRRKIERALAEANTIAVMNFGDMDSGWPSAGLPGLEAATPRLTNCLVHLFTHLQTGAWNNLRFSLRQKNISLTVIPGGITQHTLSSTECVMFCARLCSCAPLRHSSSALSVALSPASRPCATSCVAVCVLPHRPSSSWPTS